MSSFFIFYETVEIHSLFFFFFETKFIHYLKWEHSSNFYKELNYDSLICILNVYFLLQLVPSDPIFANLFT